MPWASIISFLVTFLFQKKKGKSTSSALLAGAAVGAATYLLADPSNPDNLFRIGVDSTGTAAAGASTVQSAGAVTTSGTSGITDVLGKTVTTAGSVLSSWGGTGTAAVIGTTALATNSSLSKYLPWVLGVGAILLLTR